MVGFDADWLGARAPIDEAALDRRAVAAIRTWAAGLPDHRTPVVVDLGSGTGTALARVRRWLTPRELVAYAVDRDARLLSGARSADDDWSAVPIVGDLLDPLDARGGPSDGSVDLVVSHALADLVPLDRLSARVRALLRPGGLAHIALAYDGLTAFSVAGDDGLEVDAGLEAVVVAAFHRHMDRSRALVPSYGGSTAGRRLGPALAAAGLEIVTDAPSIWQVRADRGHDERRVLAWLMRFVVEAAREIGGFSAGDLERWEHERRAALAAGTLAARVGHRDVLARAPGPGSTHTD